MKSLYLSDSYPSCRRHTLRTNASQPRFHVLGGSLIEAWSKLVDVMQVSLRGPAPTYQWSPRNTIDAAARVAGLITHAQSKRTEAKIVGSRLSARYAFALQIMPWPDWHW